MIINAPVEPKTAAGVPAKLGEYISPSRLGCWLSCPLKFRLRYLDEIRTPTTPNLFLGKAVHAGLEFWYRNRQFGKTLAPEAVVDHLHATWAGLLAEEQFAPGSADEGEQLRQKTVEVVTAYIQQVPAEERRPLAVETTLETPLVDPETGEDLGISLLGVLDLVLHGEGGPIIADFKTAAQSTAPSEIQHELQLTSYAYLFRRLSGTRESELQIRSLVKTKTPKIIVHSYPARTNAHFRRLFAVIREYLDALQAGRFNYRPGFGCQMCEFCETHCRGWCG